MTKMMDENIARLRNPSLQYHPLPAFTPNQAYWSWASIYWKASVRGAIGLRAFGGGTFPL